MCFVLAVISGNGPDINAPDINAPDLPAETFCNCGALLQTDEERRWGACSACLDAPLDFTPTEAGTVASETAIHRNLLRNVARQLDEGGDMVDPDFRERMAVYIRAVLYGDKVNDYLTCATCQEPPALCRCT